MARRRSRNGSAFTIVELLIVCAIVAVLSAISVVVIGRAKEGAKITQCLANLSQLGKASDLYRADFDDRFPPYLTFREAPNEPSGRQDRLWREAIFGYVKSDSTFYCPSDSVAKSKTFTPGAPESHFVSSYGHSYDMVKLLPGPHTNPRIDSVPMPDPLPYMHELIVEELLDGLGRPVEFITPHRGWQNFLYLDGHVDRRAMPKPYG